MVLNCIVDGLKMLYFLLRIAVYTQSLAFEVLLGICLNAFVFIAVSIAMYKYIIVYPFLLCMGHLSAIMSSNGTYHSYRVLLELTGDNAYKVLGCVISR